MRFGGVRRWAADPAGLLASVRKVATTRSCGPGAHTITTTRLLLCVGYELRNFSDAGIAASYNTHNVLPIHMRRVDATFE